MGNYYHEVVPHTEEHPRVVHVELELEGAREERNKVGRWEVTRVHWLFLEMRMQIWQKDWNESI